MLANGVHPADLHIDHGVIGRIERTTRPAAAEAGVIDVGNRLVLPGLVDSHVHVNEPGRTEWEGFDTATRAAAAGGITTIVDMPLNCVPATTSVDALDAKRAAAHGSSHVDVAFWGGVVPGNAPALDALAAAGVRGFKCFLVPSGVDEFQPVADVDLRAAMPRLARCGVPLLVHAESPDRIRPAADARPDRYATYLDTRPSDAEVEAIRMIVDLAREFGVRVHIVHVASAEAAHEIAGAKAHGVPITAETCPHYLTFAAEEIPDGAPEYKCAPPIRASSHREALWAALGSGTLDVIATDHSPAPPAMKCHRDLLRAWGGIASLELSLAAVWTRLVADATPESCERAAVVLAGWMSRAPAALAGLESKGRIAEGYDADLVIWDPDVEWVVDPDRLQQRHKITPYAARRLRGRVEATYLRGVRVWADGRLERGGAGRLL